MERILLFFVLFSFQSHAQTLAPEQVTEWEQQAKQVSIIRDHYGIPHIYGKTDADAVFGLLYAQCEDDFKRVEMNYIEKLGRLAEVLGEEKLYDDLLIRLLIDSTDAIADYNRAPEWLRRLCNAFADGINYYLHKNPAVKPVLINHFQPWYPLLWTDGSIGAITTADITTSDLQNLYSGKDDPVSIRERTVPVTGSNGFAFSPSITESGNAILYINPHVTFYFRPEVHVVSEEGLNAYGAVTWGQFFVYQGFNENCGWMHTSSNVDVSDTYIENISLKNNQMYYLYNGSSKPVLQKEILLHYKDGTRVSSKKINALYTGHGPVMAKRNGQLLSLKSNNRDMTSLVQSWSRTKAKNFAEYKKVMDLLANTSNNTVYADAEGNIAYWHGNYIPKRDLRYDWSKPVDGTSSKTEWKALHKVKESVHIYNPPNGWIENCNSTPFTVAGEYSPKKEKYPVYMAPDGQNFRGVNAVRILGQEKSYTIDKVIGKGYDNYLAAFEVLVPPLTNAFEKSVSKSDSTYALLKGAIDSLKSWNYRCEVNSVATTLAVHWGESILPAIARTTGPKGEEEDHVAKTKKFAAAGGHSELVEPLLATIKELEKRFGDWKITWGSINRFQRISADNDQAFNDDAPSFPVKYAASIWGMLPSYVSRTFPGTQKRYGVNGNSFICAVEFGKRIKAKSLLAGGQSGDPGSKHFNDQGLMYSKGEFKDVLFYKEDILKHMEENYHPGE